MLNMAGIQSVGKPDLNQNPSTQEETTVTSKTTPQDSGDESDDENEVLEESPDGRYKKQKIELSQVGSLGIDAFLGMDTEEGVEVVWNEIWFSEERMRSFRERNMVKLLDTLTNLEHANIVEFYDYWIHREDDTKNKSRITFITEYMTSGSLKQFLKKTKKNQKGPLQEKLFKRWCRQILSALNHLASSDPPLIHGNLSLDTIYIQHNGLIKIGSVVPETISYHAKTTDTEIQNIFTAAPEYKNINRTITTAVDIYAFGICALEIATQFFDSKSKKKPVLGLNYWKRESVENCLEEVEHCGLRDFLSRCLNEDPSKRPSARKLLLDKYIFEVHSLKLQAAHTLVDNDVFIPEDLENIPFAVLSQTEGIAADIPFHGSDEPFQFSYSQAPAPLDLAKYIEEVRSGLFPLTSVLKGRDWKRNASIGESTDDLSIEDEIYAEETKSILSVQCKINNCTDDENKKRLIITLKMEEKVNRELSCDVSLDEDLSRLAEELVHYGFIKQDDKERISQLLTEKLKEAVVQ